MPEGLRDCDSPIGPGQEALLAFAAGEIRNAYTEQDEFEGLLLISSRKQVARETAQALRPLIQDLLLNPEDIVTKLAFNSQGMEPSMINGALATVALEHAHTNSLGLPGLVVVTHNPVLQNAKLRPIEVGYLSVVQHTIQL